MKLLFIGDTVGKTGRRMVSTVLSSLREKYSPDIVIQNSENLAGGVCANNKVLLEMESSGVDFFTGGNHSFQDISIYKTDRENLIRPANLEDDAPGIGYKIWEKNGKRMGIINLLGRVFMKIPVICPFRTARKILDKWKNEKLDGIFIDFHTETTSEKSAFFHHFRKDISAIIGTHTHVPTADGKIWEGGTFFLTDVGMTGPIDSIIGLKIDSGIENFLSPVGKKKIQPAQGLGVFRAIFLDISKGKTHDYEVIEIFEDTK